MNEVLTIIDIKLHFGIEVMKRKSQSKISGSLHPLFMIPILEFVL